MSVHVGPRLSSLQAAVFVPEWTRPATGVQDWPEERNITLYAFHPGARDLYIHWEPQVAGLVSGVLPRLSRKPKT